MRKELIPAFLLTFVNVLGVSILMPILPFVVRDYGADEWVYGLLLTLYSAFQFIGAPYLGALSDRKGRKPILLISQAGTLLSWVIFLLALNISFPEIWGISGALLIIGLSRAFDGLTGGNASVTNAYVADITTKSEKSYIFGYLGGIAGIALIVGPGIGGFTASTPLGYSGTLYAALLISFVTLLSIFFWLKESHQPEQHQPGRKTSVWENLFILRRIKAVNVRPIIKVLFLTKFFFSIMMALYISTIALFVVDLFDFSPKELGGFMLVVGIFLSFNQAVMSRIIIRKLGEVTTLLTGLTLAVIGLISITLTDNFWLYISFYYIMNLGLSLCFPTFNALIAIHANPEKQGEIMGISESINAFAMAVFPILGASLYAQMGFAVYYIIAALPLIALIVTIRQLRHIS